MGARGAGEMVRAGVISGRGRSIALARSWMRGRGEGRRDKARRGEASKAEAETKAEAEDGGSRARVRDMRMILWAAERHGRPLAHTAGAVRRWAVRRGGRLEGRKMESAVRLGAVSDARAPEPPLRGAGVMKRRLGCMVASTEG